MKKLGTTLSKHKWMFMTLAFSTVILAISLSVGFTQVDGVNSTVLSLNNWFKAHQYSVLVWHTLIVIAIYYFWGKKVDKSAKQRHLTKDQTKRLKRFRFWMIAFIAVVDLLLFWY